MTIGLFCGKQVPVARDVSGMPTQRMCQPALPKTLCVTDETTAVCGGRMNTVSSICA